MANAIPVPAIFAVLLSAGTWVLAQETEEKEAKRIGFIFEGVFERADFAKKPDGAQKTQLVASYEWDYGTRSFTEKSWKEHGLDWDRFTPIAENLANSLAEKIKPRFVRDFRQVIEYALYESEDPFLSSILLSPRIHEELRETLGDEMRVVVVDRYRFYVFPATGGKFEEFGEALVGDFVNTEFPVSLEVFRLDENGLEVIGELERPGFDQ